MMKATYRIFSAHPFLNAIALFALLTAVLMIGWGTAMLFKISLHYLTTDYILFLPALLLVLLFNIWLLSSSILPIIKIDTAGITAWSIFWKKSIDWKDVHTVRLIKVENRYHTSGATVHFADTQQPEKKRVAALNKGYAVNTFIVMSDKSWTKPQDIIIKRGLYNHHLIAGEHAVAFEYDPHAWKIINAKRLTV
jgi:hypothetical protein